MVAPQPADFDPQLAEIIQSKKRKLIGRCGLTRDDAEDVAQELYLRTFLSMQQHDETRTPRGAFANLIVDREIATIIEGRNAQKRDWRKHRQLDDAADLLPDPAEIQHKRDRILDMRNAVSRLSPDLRQWAGWFAEFTEAEIIKLKGQPRGIVRAMRARLAAALKHVGGEKET